MARHRRLHVTVAGTCQNTGCAAIGQALISASLSFAPVPTLTDTAGKPAAGTRADLLLIF
jgi:hypothetical protein